MRTLPASAHPHVASALVSSRRHTVRPQALVALLALAAGLIISGCAGATTTHGTSATATPTVPACPTPSTATPQDLLALRACGALGGEARLVKTSYDAHSATLAITFQVGGVVPQTDAQVAAAQEQAKTICFRAQQALWTSSPALKEISVIIVGPVQGEYADFTIDVWGVAVFDAPTTAQLDWTTLTPDTAWNRYDREFLRPSFTLVDAVPGAP